MLQLILLLLAFGLMQAAGSFGPLPGIGSSRPAVTMAAGFVLLTGLLAGNLFKQCGLPRLTGYLTLGILVGPHAIGLLTERVLEDLRIFNGAAIALIALTAGAEMDIRKLRPLLRGVAWIAAFSVLGTGLVLAAAVYLLKSWLPFTYGLSVLQMVGLAVVLGITMSAKSPAVVVALRKETESDGPLTRTVLGAVVLADLGVILLFALALSFVRPLLGGAAAEGMTALSVVWEILGSLAVGPAIGILIASFMRSVHSSGSLFMLLIGFLVAEVGQRIHLDPLLIALSAGMMVRNGTRFGDRLHADIEAASMPVYVGFFAVAGATIHLDALATVMFPASVLVITRALSFVVGSRIGAHLAESPDVVRRYAGFGLIPQAGLALALALLFTRSFPQIGDEASALVFGIVGLNELAAPIAYKWALVKSGEAGKLLAQKSDADRAAPEPITSLTPAAE
jgi:Kef-type K+ transport system membrane component KefB